MAHRRGRGGSGSAPQGLGSRPMTRLRAEVEKGESIPPLRCDLGTGESAVFLPGAGVGRGFLGRAPSKKTAGRESSGPLLGLTARRAGEPAPTGRPRRWPGDARRGGAPGTVCDSTATPARTLPGTLASTSLRFAVASRQFRATSVRLDVVYFRPFGSRIPLCMVSPACGKGPPACTWALPCALFAAWNASSTAEFLPFESPREQLRRKRSKMRSFPKNVPE